ncbi:MAG TPA: sigma-54 dependent transcriptional regulator [Acidobacteriota bacterium]|nr:sigma-54 dependent transcriptional regulator [Acidobacteriota bacterium]
MILIVDDDSAVRASLSLLLKQANLRSQSAASPSEALSLLEQGAFTLVLQDMNFSRRTTGEEGMALLNDLKARWPDIPVILITAWGSIALAVRGIRAGAADFITKPWTNEQLLQSVRTVLALAEANFDARNGVRPTREDLDRRYDFSRTVGRDPKLLNVLDVIGRVSGTDASVLITGESGTGKELIAEAIHRNSPRRDGAFVKVNLGGISAALFESEMFGHRRGAFTDAHKDREGRFQIADGGTIFLDEIGDLDPGSQVKLLRVVQDRTYEVLGSSEPRTVDVRIVSATNRHLLEMVDNGDFREDLLYRLNLITVHLPPLRERTGDIPLLAAHFLEQAASVYRRRGMTVSEAGLRWLQDQPWPGNIRELKQLIERTVLLADSDTLDAADLDRAAAMPGRAAAEASLPPPGSMTLDEVEQAMIRKCMSHYAGNVSRVAEALGLSRAALYRRFEKYGIQP